MYSFGHVCSLIAQQLLLASIKILSDFQIVLEYLVPLYYCHINLQISNNCHPGIGLDQPAAEHIQEILICLFFELLECHPQTIEDMERSMRTTLPASMFHWVIQVTLDSSLFIHYYCRV